MYEPLIHRWDLATDKDLRPTAGHTNHVQSLAFGADDKTLISSGTDGQVWQWHLKSVRELLKHPTQYSTLEAKDRIPLGRIAVSRDGKFFAVPGPGPDVSVSMLDAATGKVVQTLTGGTGVYTLALAPNGKFLAVGDSFYRDSRAAGRVHIWNLKSGEKPQLIEGHNGIVLAVAFSPDSRTLASGADGVRLWDVATGKQVRRFLDHGGTNGLAFSPDGKTLVSVGRSNIVWDVETGQQLHRLPVGFAGAVAVSPNGKLLATGGSDHLVRLWDLASARELAQLAGHVGRVHVVAFSHDGNYLASGSEDTTILLWDVASALLGDVKSKQVPVPVNLEALWADLAKADARAGYKAIMAMSNAPVPTLDFFKTRLKPAVQEEKEPGLVLPVPEGKLLRTLRAIEILERIGTTPAQQMLRALAKGAPARITREAQAALERLERSHKTKEMP
jgi:WD40 repeat protein